MLAFRGYPARATSKHSSQHFSKQTYHLPGVSEHSQLINTSDDELIKDRLWRKTQCWVRRSRKGRNRADHKSADVANVALHFAKLQFFFFQSQVQAVCTRSGILEVQLATVRERNRRLWHMKTKYKKTQKRRRKQSFSLVPLVSHWWKKKLEVTSVFMLREKNPMNKSARICNHTFPSCLIEQSKVPTTSFLTESHIRSTLPKKASENSSVLGTTGLKSPNPALPSDPFLKSALNPDKQ